MPVIGPVAGIPTIETGVAQDLPKCPFIFPDGNDLFLSVNFRVDFWSDSVTIPHLRYITKPVQYTTIGNVLFETF